MSRPTNNAKYQNKPLKMYVKLALTIRGFQTTAVSTCIQFFYRGILPFVTFFFTHGKKHWLPHQEIRHLLLQAGMQKHPMPVLDSRYQRGMSVCGICTLVLYLMSYVLYKLYLVPTPTP
jgi:hypothetical protein